MNYIGKRNDLVRVIENLTYVSAEGTLYNKRLCLKGGSMWESMITLWNEFWKQPLLYITLAGTLISLDVGVIQPRIKN